MKIDKEQIEKEMEQWKSFYNNYNDLSVQVLVDVLAYYKKEDREDLIKKANEVLENVKEPITGALMIDSIKGDLDSFERINNEALVAYRTLEWIKSISNDNDDNDKNAETNKTEE